MSSLRVFLHGVKNWLVAVPENSEHNLFESYKGNLGPMTLIYWVTVGADNKGNSSKCHTADSEQVLRNGVKIMVKLRIEKAIDDCKLQAVLC